MQSRQIDLTINKMTKAQFNNITPNPDEVYLITDDNGLTQSDIITALGYTPANANSIGNATITVTQGGVSKGTFTTNQTSNATIALDAGGSGGIQNTATGTDSLTILGTPATYGNSINIGSGSSVQNAYSTTIGNNSSAAKFASALGYSSVASANGSIQLGYGTNSAADTLNVGFYKSVNPVNYQLLDGTTGLIPDARLSSNIARTSQLTTPTYDSTNERITW